MFHWVQLKHLAEWCGTEVKGDGQISVPSLSTDSRTIKPGEVFIPLRGSSFDGHQFLDQAVASGAGAVITDKPFASTVPVLRVSDTLQALVTIGTQLRRQFAGTVVGITGSAGKSSTKEMTGRLLGEKALVSPGSFNNLIGVSKTLCLVQDDTSELVLEMGMNALGEIRELCDHFRPMAGLITNIGDAHMGKVGGEKGVYQAKKEMFDYFRDNPHALGIALNVGDAKVVRAYEEAFASHKPNTVRYGVGAEPADCDVRMRSAEVDPDTAFLKVNFEVRGSVVQTELPIFGQHHAENLAAAIAVATLVGVPLEKQVERLEKIRPAAHRGVVLRLADERIVIDEAYNSNPSALRSSLKSLSFLNPSRRKVLFIGDMLELGDFAKARHKQLGEELVRTLTGHSYVLIGVGPLTQHLVESARTLNPKLETQHFADATAAGTWAKAELRAGDLLFIKGSRGGKLESLLAAF